MNLPRITKGQARALYLSGKPFVICASNLNPYWLGCHVDKQEEPTKAGFERLVNEYKYYNCLDKQTGRGVKFYTDEEWERNFCKSA